MNTKIVVTVCSANFLAQAKALADSVIRFNPDHKVIIGLVDRLKEDFDISVYHPHILLQVHEMDLPEFPGMYKRYNTLELNCALKSFFVNWALKKYQPHSVMYLDADMLAYHSFSVLDEMINESSVLITPHITKPFPQDKCRPAENGILKTGMFNAGFFAIKNDKTGNELINWWKDRMTDQGYERPKDGYNCDQNWLNFVPLYFQKVKIVTDPGVNVAYWNLHERNVEKKENNFFVNNEPLILFHFSGYSIQSPGKLSQHQDRFLLKNNSALEELFKNYQDILIQNGHPELQKILPYYRKSAPGTLFKKIGFKK